ncbi:MAG TPA: SCO family protein [Vicinamibacterales bacterium]|nr:SCO family protein [Vicinamibacterales bacterium]
MRLWWVPLFVAIALGACRRPPDASAREYTLEGQILAVRPERSEVIIKHGDIKGFMPGMTMPFKVNDAALLKDKAPGDLVKATLVVGEVEAHLSTLTKTGHVTPDAPPPAPPLDIRQPGEPIADAHLIDQDGKPVAFSSFRGHRVAITFIYTRCPLPDFCPLMDKHFADVQKTLAATPALADVRLVTVTLDPAFDTPKVLNAHAKRQGADFTRWTFLTGDPPEVNQFGSQLGIYVEHSPTESSTITHNLRTAVIDPDGRLVTIHTGNDWTPAELVADLKATRAPTH